MELDDVGRGHWQEQFVCLEIHNRSRAEQQLAAAACSQEELDPRIPSIASLICEPSPRIASTSLPECRICHEEDDPSQLETPCGCCGTLKYAHRACVQRWCNEKGDTICEICQQPFKHGYSVSESEYQAGEVTIAISDEWGIELRDPWILTLAAADQRRFLESDHQAFAIAADSGSAACCRSVALIVMALLILCHAIAMAAATENEDVFMFVLVFLLRVVGFLLPCYILIRAMNALQQGRQEQAAAMAAAELSLMLQARHQRGLRLAMV